ncbi:uncharacterized protein LOC124438156 isoform X2 [Xenia sp. Carnegie-2017]|uniref:uncharacterized protein LOC124438156 isoform X2 n=1 Tax=Xenia sp. Carnegie-2017 TaxID=2897299 RepID=UPI001F03A0D0|nr:uncharacterized protein LOC124438156 isoform X2 [Xenia sp. Carnegie-2017]
MEILEEGNCSMNNGDYETAIEHYNSCVEVADEKSIKMMAYFCLGNAYTLSDKGEEAISCFNDCLNLSSQLEIKYFQHQIYFGLGSIHSTTKRLEDSIKKEEMVCLCHVALGGLNKLLENYEKSLEHYRKGFSLIESQELEDEMLRLQLEDSEQKHYQMQRQKKVRKGGINVSKDFVNCNMKNLSIVTSAGIVNGVLAVYWELAELFDKLEELRDAIDVYEMYLHIVNNDKDIAKQKNAMERLIRLYEEEGRDLQRDSMKEKLHEVDKIIELQLQEWKYNDPSIKHQELFLKMIEYGRDPNVKVSLLNDVRVIFSDEFCIGKGSDGTRVYLGLGNNGYGKAVKRIHKDNGKDFANREKEILNVLNAKRSNYVVNFCHLEENLDKEYLYVVLDLCEESLESYVKSSSLQDLQKVVPKVLIQILNGLVHLHSGERPILHRDLRPSNVLRDVQGNFLIADFGISHMLSDETSTHLSIQRGAKNWIAPESYDVSDASINKVRYKKESDIMNAGMVAYYVATKGKHPFGHERHRLDNILNGNQVGLDEIKDATFKDLLSWMLQLIPEDRPSADKALKHPYLQSDEEKFNMLCDMGNQLEVKYSQGQNSPPSDDQLYGFTTWMKRIDDEVVKDLINFEVNDSIRTLNYESTWAGCLRFIRNVDQHCQNKPRPHLSQYMKQGNYKKYFLQCFPELPLLVHKIIRTTDWKTRPDLKKYFTNTKLVEQLEEINGKKSEDINGDMDLDEIERVNGRKNKENPSHDVFLKDGLDMEENEDVAQSQKLDSFLKSLIQSGRWKVGDMYRFRRSLVLGSAKGTLYICKRMLGSENEQVVLNLLKAGRGVEVVNEIEKYSIEGRTVRQQAIVFFLAVCARKGDLATKRQAYDALPKICRIPTLLFMFIEFCKLFSQPGKGWGRAHRNAIKRWYKEKDPCKLAMDITKYQRREGWSHRDVARLMHLKPEGTDVSDELFVIMKYVVCGWQRLFEYFFPEDNTAPHRPIGEKGSAMLVFFKAVEEVKTAQEEARVVELINQHNLVREHIPTHWLNSKEVWRALVQKMPMTAMLRNLGKMTIVELLDEQMALSCICEKLLNQDLLKRARIHPFNVLVALKIYVDGHGDRGKLTWNPNEAIVNALKEAFYLSFKLIQPTNKRYMLALDVSASMSYSGFAGTPCLTPCVAAAVMSMVTARTESKHLFVAFSYKIVPLMISSDMTLDEVVELMKLIPNGGTDCAQPMLYAIENNLEVDVFIVYTDSETKAGFIHPSEALKRYRQYSGIQAKLIVVAMTSNGFTIADPEDIGMLDIVGFDSAAPQMIREFISS